jgi:hypothetical protein
VNGLFETLAASKAQASEIKVLRNIVLGFFDGSVNIIDCLVPNTQIGMHDSTVVVNVRDGIVTRFAHNLDTLGKHLEGEHQLWLLILLGAQCAGLHQYYSTIDVRFNLVRIDSRGLTQPFDSFSVLFGFVFQQSLANRFIVGGTFQYSLGTVTTFQNRFVSGVFVPGVLIVREAEIPIG